MGLLSGMGKFAGSSQKKIFGPQVDAAWEIGGGEESMEDYARAIEAIRSGYDSAIQGYQPWEDFGGTTRNYMTEFMKDPSAIYKTDAYKFRLGEGTKAVENSAIARGGLFSGNAMRGIMDYGQGLASQEYANEFARRAGLTQLGMQTGNTMAGLRANQGTALGNAYSGRGSAYFDQHLKAAQEARAWHDSINEAASGWFGAGKGMGGG